MMQRFRYLSATYVLLLVFLTGNSAVGQTISFLPSPAGPSTIPVKGSIFLSLKLEASLDVQVVVRIDGYPGQRRTVRGNGGLARMLGFDFRIPQRLELGAQHTLSLDVRPVGGDYSSAYDRKITVVTPVPGGCFTTSERPRLISPLICAKVVQEEQPFVLSYADDYDGDTIGGLEDLMGKKIGFTAFFPPKNGDTSPFDRSKLAVKNGALFVTSAPGDWRDGTGELKNALAVGMPPPRRRKFVVRARFNAPSVLTGAGEKFCLFLARTEDRFVRICVTSEAASQISFLVEHVQRAKKMYSVSRQTMAIAEARSISLSLEIFRRTREVVFLYAVDNADFVVHSRLPVSSLLLSAFGRMDGNIGTNSFIGISTSSGRRSAAVPPAVWVVRRFATWRADGDSVDYRCIPISTAYNGRPISTLPCEQVKVKVPLRLQFDSPQQPRPMPSSIADRSGRDTGFTMVVPSTRLPTTLDPSLLSVDGGYLHVTSPGGNWQGPQTNNLPNVLAVGLPFPDSNMRLSTRVLVPRGLTASGERFCLSLAASDQDFIWVCVVSPSTPRPATPDSTVRIAFWQESLDTQTPPAVILDADLDDTREVELSMVVSHSPDEVDVTFRIGKGARQDLVTRRPISGLLVNRDQATLDPELETRSFGGIASTHGLRNSTQSGRLTWRVDHFHVVPVARKDEDEDEQDDEDDRKPRRDVVDFDTWTIYGIQDPSSMVFAPDGWLYVASTTGVITALRIDHETQTVRARREIRPWGNEVQMLVGITTDPDWTSSPGERCLWLAHTIDRRLNNRANTSKISRLCGPNFNRLTDVIVGLPCSDRAHSVNNIHFKDGKLYIASGGNTGSGATNTRVGTFYYPEQPLSAAILVADVKRRGFQGDCTPNQSVENLESTRVSTKRIPSSCDVKVYASGLRNAFDFWVHPNGHMYSTDNALATAARNNYPPVPRGWRQGDDCSEVLHLVDEIASYRPETLRLDLLQDVVEGGYYGHPNPSRDECVFFGANPTRRKDVQVPLSPVQRGNTWSMEETKYPVGTQPDPNFIPAMMAFGDGKSPDGIISYNGTKFCGQLQDELLVTYWADTPQVRRLKLSRDGTRVESDRTLHRTTAGTEGRELANPLGITQDAEGNLYVGEYHGNSVYVMTAKQARC